MQTMRKNMRTCTYSVMKMMKIRARSGCNCFSTIGSTTPASVQYESNQKQTSAQTPDLQFDQEAALYVHWPYCARRCTYCNFNKYISNSVDHERMAACLVRELKTLLNFSQVKKINSTFFGGGTPSLSLPSTIAQVVDAVQSQVMFSDSSEVTLEANPTHLQTNRLSEFKDAGINRLSVGVQSLNDEDLKTLGRDHSATEAIACIEEAKKMFGGHVSVDVIFGRPGQTLSQWETELHKILSLCDKHISLYQLTVERGTMLYKWVEKGLVQMPDNDTMADMYLLAVQLLKDKGLERYEVSNFAKKGYESQHNQAYWQEQAYLGIGPGAHGRFHCMDESGNITRQARIQTLEPDNWMYEVDKFGHATRKIVNQTTTERLEELLLVGLRTRDGIPHQRWNSLTRYHLPELFQSNARLQQFVRDGLLVLDERGLRATAEGILILDSILPHIVYALHMLLEENDLKSDSTVSTDTIPNTI